MSSPAPGRPLLRQGTVDTFCSIYAVLNALRLIRNLRILECREIFNTTLLRLSETGALAPVLTQQADYGLLVDDMLDSLPPDRRLGVLHPFRQGSAPTQKKFIDTCSDWFSRPRRAAIVSFERYISPDAETPFIRHWTTISGVRNDGFLLADASPQPFDSDRIPFREMILTPAELDVGRLTRILVPTLRLLFLP